MNLTSWIYIFDFATAGQISYQSPATFASAGIANLHDYIISYITFVVFFVLFILVKITNNFYKKRLTLGFLSHGVIIEIIWTILPALILVLISIPSFRLLYSLDFLQNPKITLKILGLQWYWRYQIGDFSNPIEFDSFIVQEEDLESGQLRLLEVDNRVILPINVSIRGLVTANDVLHCFTVPSLGVKVDAVPGRLNQINFTIARKGIFFGQCSELCGTSHYGIPIVIQGVELPEFLTWLNNSLEE